MNLLKISILISLGTLNLYCSTITIPKSNSNFTIVKSNDNKIIKTSSNYFVSGYYSQNGDYYLKDNVISIGITDSIYFYKLQNKNDYYCIPMKPYLFDLSKSNGFSIFPKLTNINTLDYPIDEWILKKNEFHNIYYPTKRLESPFTIMKDNFKYNKRSFIDNGITEIYYEITINPIMKPDPLLFKIVNAIVSDKITVSDIVYIESFTKNVTIENVIQDPKFFRFGYFHGHERLRWDFKELNDSNYLILYYDKSDVNRVEEEVPRGVSLQIYGIYKK